MRMHNIVGGALVAIALATFGSRALSAEPKNAAAPTQVAAAADKAPAQVTNFVTLKGIKAVPMAESELEAVKGQHVHFVDPGSGEIHLAGNPEHQNNWENLGGSDGKPVAPSYHGLCVAAGYSGPSAGAILIPGGQLECPL